MNLSLSTAALAMVLGSFNNSPSNFFPLGEVVPAEIHGTASTDPSAKSEVSNSDIRNKSARNVSDAISQMPGANVIENSRREKMFYVRGFEQRQVPVLFDGIPVYVPYDGYIDAGKLPAGNISRITVTKGPIQWAE